MMTIIELDRRLLETIECDMRAAGTWVQTETVPITQAIVARQKTAERNVSMSKNIFQELESLSRTTQEADCLLSVDPAVQDIVRRHVEHELDLGREQLRLAEPTPGQLAEADSLLGHDIRESDADFEKRLAEQHRQRFPMEHVSAAAVLAIDETLTVTTPSGLLVG